MITRTVPVPNATYTLKQNSSVCMQQWINFTLAITDAFWKLPAQLRPCLPATGENMTHASQLFPDYGVFVFCGRDFPGSLAEDVLVTAAIGAEQRRKSLLIQTQRQPIDLFTRIALILLHHHCKGCFDISSSIGGVSWALPVRWAKHHRLVADHDAPQPFCSCELLNSTADELLVMSVSGAEGNFDNAAWGVISRFEFVLNDLRFNQH